MRPILFLFLFISLPIVISAQDYELGKTKKQIERELATEGKKLTQGISNEGIVYLMHEEWDGFEGWYFNDAMICTHYYLSMRSATGKDRILKLRILAGQHGSKIDNQTYELDGLVLKFSNPSNEEIAVVISKK